MVVIMYLFLVLIGFVFLALVGYKGYQVIGLVLLGLVFNPFVLLVLVVLIQYFKRGHGVE